MIRPCKPDKYRRVYPYHGLAHLHVPFLKNKSRAGLAAIAHGLMAGLEKGILRRRALHAVIESDLGKLSGPGSRIEAVGMLINLW